MPEPSPPREEIHNMRPKVGISCLVQDTENRFLVGQRKGSHGAGKSQFPGGHLEYAEEWAQAAMQELQEEANIETKLEEWSFSHATNDVMTEDKKHYITIFMVLSRKITEEEKPNIQNLEPHKNVGWEFMKFSDIPDPKFLPITNLEKSLSDGRWKIPE